MKVQIEKAKNGYALKFLDKYGAVEESFIAKDFPDLVLQLAEKCSTKNIETYAEIISDFAYEIKHLEEAANEGLNELMGAANGGNNQ